MKVSVVICTRNRPAVTRECLASVFAQSQKPDEVIIVDASDVEDENLKHDLRIKYVRAKPGLSHQRNVGVGNCTGDLIFFLDDDTVLDGAFIEKIVKVFRKDKGLKVGGVMGDIVNAKVSGSLLKRLSYSLHLLIQRAFLLPTFGNGNFQLSGCPTYPYGSREIKRVEFLAGGITAYRRVVFNDFRFEEDAFSSDDDDFSYRVSRRYINVYTPYAKIIHNASPVARQNSFTRSRNYIESRYNVFQRNFPQDAKHKLAFSWSLAGDFLRRILSMDMQGLEGLIVGISNFGTLKLVKNEFVD